METSARSLAERLGSKRAGGGHREHSRLSKASIGQPMNVERNGKTSEMKEGTELPGGPSMVQKCVLVQKDEKGYGLTVSGDNPVFVQSVKEDGAAARAGVLQGDRIIKVNGQKVTDLNHVEVVKLIKGENYVALTLFGLSPSAAPVSGASGFPVQATKSDYITGPSASKQDAFYNEKVETIKKMLEQESAEVERIKEEYARNPEQKILIQLGTAQKLKQDLEKQLWKAESMQEKQQLATLQPQVSTNPFESTDVDDQIGDEPVEEQAPLIDMGDSSDTTSTSQSLDEISNRSNNDSIRSRRSQTMNDINLQSDAPANVISAEEQTTMDILNEFQPNNPFMCQDATQEDGGPLTPQQNKEIMNFEEDDIVSTCTTFQNHGPFNDLDKLRQRPAHLAVFFNYLISSRESANFLLSLAVESYRQLSSAKEMTKQAEAIFKTYLASSAPLKVDVDEPIVRSIQGVIGAKNNPEETLRGLFDPAVQVCNKEIRNQLSKYREKRELGLGNLIGDEKLPTNDNLDSQQEVRIVDEVITPTLNELTQSSAADDIEQKKLNIITEALHAFLGQYGSKRKTKITSRMYSILRPTKQPQNNLNRTRISGSMESILDDSKDKRSSGLFNFKKKAPRDVNSITIQPPPQIHEPVIHDAEYPAKTLQEESNENGSDDGSLSVEGPRKLRSRSGSFRRHREEEKRNSGSHKSHSDPEKNKVEQAIQSNASYDHQEQTSRHSVLSSTDSIQSLALPEDQRSAVDLVGLTSDPEINVDASEQHWSDLVPRATIRSIDTKERKRQEVINELIYTEQHHVRDLRILEKVFYEPLHIENMLTKEELNQAFPNLFEILKLHRELNKDLQEAKERDGHVVKHIGDILLDRFAGEAGNTFKTECAIYCGNQSTVLSLIKEKSKKEAKFSQFMQEAQRYPICRKLHLKDFIPMEFQRLTKYPLLLENLIKNTNKKKQDEECGKLRQACDRCRDILAFVNQTVKEAEDKQKIKELQQNLDRSPLLKSGNSSDIVKAYKNIDLTCYPIVHHGPLTWRIGQMDKRKELALHCILYDDIMVLLQKQDEKYVLKCHGTSADKTSGATHVPFIAMEKLIVRSVATDKRAFFVMTTSETGPQMYEFVATSTTVLKQWMQYIQETSKVAAVASHDRRKGFSIPNSSRYDDNPEPSPEKKLAGEVLASHPDVVASEQLPLSPELPPDIEQNRVLLEKFQSSQEVIRNALSRKHSILAKMSGIEEGDLEMVLEMSSVDDEVDPKTIVLHTLLCVDKITGLLNDCVTPENTIVKLRSVSERNQSSNRLSAEVLETGYHSDSGVTSPSERWADPVSHPSSQEERSPSPAQVSRSETLNSISEIPRSETISTTPSDGEESPVHKSQGGQALDEPDSCEGEQFYEAVDQPQLEETVENGAGLNSPAKITDKFQFETPNALAVPEDNTSESSKSRPTSGIDLLARTDAVPIKKLMEISVNLQTQLTKLMQITQENESDRKRLAEENRQLREELEKMENEGSQHLPSYAEVLQDQLSNKVPSVTSPTGTQRKPDVADGNSMSSLAKDVELVRKKLKNVPCSVFTSEDRKDTPPLPRKTRRSTGF
ncbi:rho guanine nucleotide exchange factor 11-like isoform X7 [Clavelina lepadiformis]|uniref:rho guanine nucleotide exchange factor 11-like isoform X7 n=1 Tax=Clavelina lepadiformis TaxID=159417 RepID=UPI004040FFB6